MWKWILVLPLLVSCGYTLNHRLRTPFDSPKGFFVPVFENRTDELGAEVVFTNALIRELQSRGEKVLNRRDENGVELQGTLTQIDFGSTASAEPGVVPGLRGDRRIPTQVGVTASIELKLKESKTGKVLFQRSFSSFRRVSTPINRSFDFQAPSQIGPLIQSTIEGQYSDLARFIMYEVYDQMLLLAE